MAGMAAAISPFAAAPLALVALALGGCVLVPDAPNVEGTPAPEGHGVPIDRPVRVGDLVVTPRAVVEDSRCPETARCVWPGRLIVRTRIDGAGWRDTADLTLGQTYGTHGRVIALVSATPGRQAESEIETRAYRFVYAAR